MIFINAKFWRILPIIGQFTDSIFHQGFLTMRIRMTSAIGAKIDVFERSATIAAVEIAQFLVYYVIAKSIADPFFHPTSLFWTIMAVELASWFVINFVALTISHEKTSTNI